MVYVPRDSFTGIYQNFLFLRTKRMKGTMKSSIFLYIVQNKRVEVIARTMEKLGSLESSLPPEQPPTKQAIAALNGELSQEFKFAANSVTKLYRLANEKTSLVRHQGYVQCVEDLLSFIDRGEDVSVEDIREWCIMHLDEKMETKKEQKPKLSFNLSEDYVGKSVSEELSVPTFRLSKPPLSVEHPSRPVRKRYTKRVEPSKEPQHDEHNDKKPKL